MRGLNDIAVSPHFKLKEFECRCCGAVMLAPELLDALERLRDLRGAPIAITSGYRCEAHNREVGGATRSRHMRGRAADVRCAQSEQQALAEKARAIGFAEVIAGGPKGYLHLGI